MSEEYSVRTGWSNPVSNIDKLAPALIKAQGMIEGATKGKKNDHFRSKYADLGSVWDACRDALQANGLAVVQLPVMAPAGQIGLKTIIIHTSGQSIQEQFFMPLKDPTNPQAAGSALTYARRYALSSAIGICPVDDDGNAAAAAPKEQKTAAPVPSLNDSEWKAIADGHLSSFNSSKTAEEKKAVFMMVRGSNLPEPLKTNTLTIMGNVLKGKK